MTESRFGELGLTSPYINAAGMLGFSQRGHWPENIPQGGFITNPISRRPRHPTIDARLEKYPGGVLLHTGLPNPGIKSTIKQYSKEWKHSPVPVWVHLFSQDCAEIQVMTEMLEGLDGVWGVEISLPMGIGISEVTGWVTACLGELQVVVGVSLNELTIEVVEEIAKTQVNGLAILPPRGAVRIGGKTITGRLYSPGIFPQVMQIVNQSSKGSMPLIAGGGIFSRSQADELIRVGAAAVELDLALWGNPDWKPTNPEPAVIEIDEDDED